MTIKERYAPKIPFIPYLNKPLKSFNYISEGYIYTKAERSIHRQFFHKGVDYACKYGTPVYASADGYAVASYHRFTLRDKNGFLLLYKNLPVANGLVFFVQIFHPQEVCGIKGGRITQYGHLSRIADGIKVKKLLSFRKDIVASILKHAKNRRNINKDDFDKKVRKTLRIIEGFPWVEKFYGFNFENDIESYLYTLDELKKLIKQNSPWVTYVKQGELIGYVGTSAIFYGNCPYDEENDSPDIKPFENVWDEVHLHFEEAMRDPETRMKLLQRDPTIFISQRNGIKRNLLKKVCFYESSERFT